MSINIEQQYTIPGSAQVVKICIDSVPDRWHRYNNYNFSKSLNLKVPKLFSISYVTTPEALFTRFGPLLDDD